MTINPSFKFLQENMGHDGDPKETIKKAVGDISGVELFGNSVLVGTYIRPEKTKSGIILTDKYRTEDEYQGKVGIILKVGPLAFENDPEFIKGDMTAKIGDWVTYRHADGTARMVNGYHCRNIPWIYLLEKTDSPDRVM